MAVFSERVLLLSQRCAVIGHSSLKFDEIELMAVNFGEIKLIQL